MRSNPNGWSGKPKNLLSHFLALNLPASISWGLDWLDTGIEARKLMAGK
jgi:hypothetical protein